MIEDNARAHGRSVDASWDAVAARLPAGWERSSTVVLTLKMARAVADEDWQLLTAWREKIAVDEMDGFVSLWLWKLGRAVLADTAAGRDQPVDELLSRLIHQVTNGVAPE